MANGARMDGIEASVFFTFFGMDAITTKKQKRIKVATVGNPAMGIPTFIGGHVRPLHGRLRASG